MIMRHVALYHSKAGPGILLVYIKQFREVPIHNYCNQSRELVYCRCIWSAMFLAGCLKNCQSVTLYRGYHSLSFAHNVPTLQRWSNRTRVLVLVLVLKYEYFLSTRTRTRVRRKVIVLEYITKVIVLTITSHDYIFVI